MTGPRGPHSGLSVDERTFQHQVIDLARTLGWRVAHFRPAQTQTGRWVTPVQADGAGFPDLVLVRGRRTIFAELKTDRGRLSSPQHEWIEALTEAGNEVYVWRPRVWDEVIACLSRRPPR